MSVTGRERGPLLEHASRNTRGLLSAPRSWRPPEAMALGAVPAPAPVGLGTARLPGHHLVGLENQVEELGVGELASDVLNRHAGRQRGRDAAGQEGDRDAVAAADGLLDDRARERGVGALDQVEDRGHQNASTRRLCRTRSAIRSRLTGTMGCPSAFQSGSAGTAVSSTWKGMPSALRLPRNFAMSSPSTSSSVSASSRWTPGPRSTNVTSFSPETTPSPMRIASLARCEARGSSPISTSTGWLSSTGSVERDEAIGTVDQVGEHDQTTVGEAVRVAQRDAALLASIRAHEQLGSPFGQGADARVVERAHALVDEVDVDVGASVERRLREPDGGLEVGVLEPRGPEP